MLEGHRAADRKDWNSAAKAFERVSELAPNEPMHWYWLSIVNLAAGDHEKYQHSRNELLHRAKSMEDLEWVIRAWLLTPPHSENDLAPIRPIWDAHAGHFPGGKMYRPLYMIRTGHPRDEVFDALETPTDPEEWCIMALIWLNFGVQEQALSSYRNGIRITRFAPEGSDWVRLAYAEFLRSEVEELLGIQPPKEGAELSGTSTSSASSFNDSATAEQSASQPSHAAN
jgi:hypothetical protein